MLKNQADVFFDYSANHNLAELFSAVFSRSSVVLVLASSLGELFTCHVRGSSEPTIEKKEYKRFQIHGYPYIRQISTFLDYSLIQ